MTAPQPAPAATAPAGEEREVAPGEAGERLDRLLARWLDLPRNSIQRWIDDRRVTVDGDAAKASTALRVGARVAWSPPPAAAEPGVEPEAGELAILHQDPHLVAIDKPAGIAVHPGAGRAAGTLVNLLLHRFPEIAGVGGPGRPGIVHRLDRGTTGVLLVARSELAYRRLSADFAARRVEKTYLAIAYDGPVADGTIDLPIGRDPRDRKRMAIRERDGRPARSRFRRLAAAAGVTLLEVDIESGRTHQIRVHLKAVGLPLVGDPVYGEARWRGLSRSRQAALGRFPRPALHASRLRLRHPDDQHPLELRAPVPADLRELWRAVAGPWPEAAG